MACKALLPSALAASAAMVPSLAAFSRCACSQCLRSCRRSHRCTSLPLLQARSPTCSDVAVSRTQSLRTLRVEASVCRNASSSTQRARSHVLTGRRGRAEEECSRLCAIKKVAAHHSRFSSAHCGAKGCTLHIRKSAPGARCSRPPTCRSGASARPFKAPKIIST